MDSQDAQFLKESEGIKWRKAYNLEEFIQMQLAKMSNGWWITAFMEQDQKGWITNNDFLATSHVLPAHLHQ